MVVKRKQHNRYVAIGIVYIATIVSQGMCGEVCKFIPAARYNQYENRACLLHKLIQFEIQESYTSRVLPVWNHVNSKQLTRL